VESVVNTHPAVLESAAFAVKDLVLTEDEVMITVVVKPGMKLTPEELIEFCVPRMPYFHVPRYVEITEALPKTSTDKVKKKELRDRGVSPETWDREAAGIKIKR
ncbi:MAG: ATP-dependent acyl-CoA ligase, partial [Thermodesulfobacteriota bacterium]